MQFIVFILNFSLVVAAIPMAKPRRNSIVTSVTSSLDVALYMSIASLAASYRINSTFSKLSFVKVCVYCTEVSGSPHQCNNFELLWPMLIISSSIPSALETYNPIYSSVTDHFELCLTKCRTSSLSVQHENSYKDPNYKVKPNIPWSLSMVSLKSIKFSQNIYVLCSF